MDGIWVIHRCRADSGRRSGRVDDGLRTGEGLAKDDQLILEQTSGFTSRVGRVPI